MDEDSKCPICGSETVVRISKKGPNAGRRFNVCVYYPGCKGRVAVVSVEKRLEEWKTECGKELKDGFFEDYYRRAEEKQEALKKLTDDELMELSYLRVVSLAEWANTWLITGKFKSAEMDDLAFNEAVVKEVGMRMEIAYSSWKSGEYPTTACMKWLDHVERTEEILRHVISKANSPTR